MVLFLSLAAENEDVSHIDDYHPSINEFLEYVIHHHLEHFWDDSKTKKT